MLGNVNVTNFYNYSTFYIKHNYKLIYTVYTNNL